MGNLRSILAAAALLIAVAPPAASRSAGGPFEVRHLLAHGRRLETLFYDVTGDGVPDALNVSVDYDAEPPVRWLALHPGGKDRMFPERPAQIWAVPTWACALALGNWLPDGGVEIGLIAPDGLWVYTAAEGRIVETPRKLLHTATWFSEPPARSLPVWFWEQDLNGDRLDDLVLPAPDGFKVYFQTKPGRFGAVVRLEADLAPEKRALTPSRFAVDFLSGASRGLAPGVSLFTFYDDLPRPGYVDLNGDGLVDLVNIRGGTLTAYTQAAGFRFPKRMAWVVPGLADPRRKDEVNYSDIQFADLNNDGLPDLIVTKIEGQLDLLESLRTRILPYLGTGRANFQPDDGIHIDGVSLNPTAIDMNGDGKLDLLASRLRTDILKKGLEAKILGDLTITYEVFQYGDGSKFRASPAFSKDIRVTEDDLRKRAAASRPLYYIPGDLTGDKRPDAVAINPKTGGLTVHKGRPLFSGKDVLIDFDGTDAASTELEHYPKWLTFHDLDGDGRTDVLLQYGGMVTILYPRF